VPHVQAPALTKSGNTNRGCNAGKRIISAFYWQGQRTASAHAEEPNDRLAYPPHEAIAATGKPALFHTGQTRVRSGMPGGNACA
jgi:hypothetical protein